MAISAVIGGGLAATKLLGVDISVGGILDVFGIGKSGAKKRNAIRKQLAGVGFDLIKTPSKSFGGWNIDDWNTSALQNVTAAYNKYGQIVARLHNERQLSNSLAQSRTNLDKFIESKQETAAATAQPQQAGTFMAGGNGQTLFIAAAVGVIGYLIFQK